MSSETTLNFVTTLLNLWLYVWGEDCMQFSLHVLNDGAASKSTEIDSDPTT